MLDWRQADLDEADRALCAFAEKLTATPGQAGAADVQALRDRGLTDAAIHDATQVVAYFNYINRIADGLGTDLEPDMTARPESTLPAPTAFVPPPRGAGVELTDVTEALLDAVLRLAVAPHQRRFVAPTPVSLAQAAFIPNLRSQAILAGGVPVGYVMTEPQDDGAALYVVRFLVDARVQGRGFGRQALELVVSAAREAPGVKRVTLSFVPAPGSPEPFYAAAGFVRTGRVVEGEVEMELGL